MSHHSKAQPAKASAVNATAIQDADDVRSQRRGQPSSLISPLALMALGLAGAATAGSPVLSTDQSGDATGVDQDGSDAVNAAAVAQADPLLTETSPDAVAATTDSPTDSQDITLDVAQDTALDTPQVAEAVAVASLDPALAADLATTDAAPAADGATALTLKLDMPALPGTAAEAPQLVAAAPLEGSTTLPAAAPTAAAVGATEFSMGQVAAAVAGLVAVGVAVSGSSESKDTTPPAAPTAALATDSGASATDGVTKVGTVTVGALETGSKWEYSTNAGSSWTTGTGSSFTLADGSYAANAVQVRQTDAAANVSTIGKIATAITVDNVIAAVTASLSTDSGSSATDGITNATGLALSTAAADVTRSYAVDGAAASASYVAPTADGKHSVVVTDTDTAGNSASTTLAFTLDKTIATPTVALSTDSGSSATDGISNLAALSLGAAAADVTRSYKVDGGAASASYVAPTANGAHTVQVTDTDTAGNTANANLNFTLDTVGASASISAPTATTALGATAKLTITFDGKVAGFDASDLVDAKGGKFGNLASADGGTTWTVDLTPNPDRLGPASIAVTGAYSDLAGNAGTASSAAAVKYFAYATASDGDISGAKIYADVDRSGSVTAADVLVGTTGADGSVSVALDAGQDAYALLATGGTDISTGLAFTGLLRAPAGSTMITPLTTLVQGLLDADTSTGSAAAKLAAAQAKVLSALSLPAGIDLTSYDALGIAVGSTTATAADKAIAVAVQAQAIAVANLLVAGTAALQGAATTAGGVTSANAGSAVLGALVTQFGSGAAVNLNSATTVGSLLTSAAADSQVAGSLNAATKAGLIGTASASLSVANQAVTDAMGVAAANASTSNQFLASLTDAVKVQTVAQGSVSTALASGTAVALDTTALKTQTQAVTSVNLSSTQAGVADKTAPAAPALVGKDTGTSATDGITNVGAVNVTGLEAGSTWEYSSNAGSTWVGGQGSNFVLAEGAYAANAVQVRQTDAAGNVGVAGKSAAAITVDSSAAAPSLALASDTGASATDGITKVGTVNVTGLEAGATWDYNASGTWVAGTGSSFTLADGAYASGQVRQTDVAGNLSAASKAAAITVDNTIAKPTVALVGDSGLNLSTAAADVSRSYSVDGGAASASYVAPQLNGAHTVVVTDLDTAGNSASATLSFTLDRKFVGPTLTLTDNGVSATDGITNAAGLTISTPLAGFTRSIAVDGKTVSSYVAPTTDGVHTVKVTDTDAAGNVASSSLSFTLDTVVPTATVVAPSVPNSAGALTYTVNFSEAVTGFDASDIAVVNGKAGAVTAISASQYTVAVTPTSSTSPVSLAVSVPAAGANDIAGNASTAAAQVLHSVLFGTSGNDILTVGTAQDLIYLGVGNDTVALATAAGSTTTATDNTYGFGSGDQLDLRALLNGYTSSGVADAGIGFVELKNLTLTQGASTTTVRFDVNFDAATISGSKISGAVIDLLYDYSKVSAAQVVNTNFVDPVFGGNINTWANVVQNLSGASGNGKVAVTADLTTTVNPIIDTAGKAFGVTLIVNSLVSTFPIGLESVAAGGATAITTVNGVSTNVDVGITKVAGAAVTIGNTGSLEIVTDTGKLGTVADNQLHLVTTYDKASDLTHLMIQYDTDAAKGTTSLSSVVAMDFGGDVTNLIPASLIFTGP
jgi:hypothetical protein